MSKRPLIYINRVIREMNDEEYEQWEIDQVAIAADKINKETKDNELRVKSDKLISAIVGLTDLTKEEIAEILCLQLPEAKK